MGEFNGGGVFTLDNATFVGMGTFVADMGVITMSAHAHLVLGLGDQNRGGGGGCSRWTKRRLWAWAPSWPTWASSP